MIPLCFRFRSKSERDSYVGTYEYYSLVEMSNRSNLPARAWQSLALGVSEEDLIAYKKCNSFKNNVEEHVKNGSGIFIHGGVGSGKTVWTYKIARHYMEKIAPYWDGLKHPNPVYFANVPRLLDDLRSAFKNENAMANLDDLMMHSDIVIFDDIGAENATEWAKEKLYQYIDYRYANCKTSLFTSNKTIDDLEERIADRIRGTCTLIEFKMSSKRKMSAQGGINDTK